MSTLESVKQTLQSQVEMPQPCLVGRFMHLIGQCRSTIAKVKKTILSQETIRPQVKKK